MKNSNYYILGVLMIFFLVSCETNKKLKQENAEKAIREFVSKNTFGGNGNWGQQGTFDLNSIASIEPIIQFSDSDASSIVNFTYHDAFTNKNLSLKFNFKRNIDKNWILTSIDIVAGVGSEGLANKVQREWQSLNIAAQ